MESMAYWAHDEKLAAAAMARIAPDVAALPIVGLAQVNLDPQQATDTILAVLPEVMALRSRIAMALPAFDLTRIDKLEDYTLALRFAHATYQLATVPAAELQALSSEARRLRERLRALVAALSLDDLLDPRKLQSLTASNGDESIAQDLQLLSQILQESWSRIRGKSATTAEELAAASRIGTRLARIVALREQSPAEKRALLEQIQRVFTLTMRAYDQARAAVAYVRRGKGDAESITPNLYSDNDPYGPTNEPTKEAPPPRSSVITRAY
jgi:hypothetical protein